MPLCLVYGFDYAGAMARRRLLALTTAGLMAAMSAAAAAQPREAEATVTCSNPAGGGSWRIVIDYRNGTVDANTARITPAQISWFDPKDGGIYTLDRNSGDLLGSVASATGGYFRRGHCNLEQPQ